MTALVGFFLRCFHFHFIFSPSSRTHWSCLLFLLTSIIFEWMGFLLMRIHIWTPCKLFRAKGAFIRLLSSMRCHMILTEQKNHCIEMENCIQDFVNVNWGQTFNATARLNVLSHKLHLNIAWYSWTPFTWQFKASRLGDILSQYGHFIGWSVWRRICRLSSSLLLTHFSQIVHWTRRRLAISALWVTSMCFIN